MTDLPDTLDRHTTLITTFTIAQKLLARLQAIHAREAAAQL